MRSNRLGQITLLGLLMLTTAVGGPPTVARAAIDGWRVGAPLPTGRQGVAVVATGGHIYAIGGTAVNGNPTGALEAYDPVTNTWTARAAMPTPRAYLGAAVVAGKIYAVGGLDGNGNELATTEVYTPATDSWASGPSMLEGQGGLAVVAVGGTIYAIGSGTGGTAVESLTPGGSWTGRAPLPSPRFQLAAAATGDGRIVAMGGYANDLGTGFGYPTADVEIYDPAANAWSAGPPMTFGRIRLSAATGPDGRVYAIGGDVGDNPYAYPSVEAYDPRTNAWSLTSDIPTARAGSGAAVGPDGRLYVIGGWNETNASASTAVESYLPPAAAPAGWTSGPAMPGGRWGLAGSVTQNGQIIVIGGAGADGTLVKRPLLLDPTTGAWTNAPALIDTNPFFRAAAVPAADGVHAIGGWGGRPIAGHQVMHAGPRAYAWQNLAHIPGRRELPAAAVAPDGYVYAAGGHDGRSFLSTAFRYHPWQSPGTDRWRAIASMPQPRAGGVMATGSDGKLVYAGGLSTGGYARNVRVYDPGTDTWSATAPLPDPRFAASGLEGPDGRIYVIGGYDPVLGDVPRVDIYSPDTGTWTCGPPMPAGASNLATALFDGNIYAIGGVRGSRVLATTHVYHVGAIPHDPSPPAFSVTPRAGFSAGTQLGRVDIPIRIHWRAAAAATDIRRYELAASTDGDAYTPETLPWDVIDDVIGTYTPGIAVNQVAITATDCSGNSSTSTSAAFVARAAQENKAAYRGAWSTGTSSRYYGGHTRHAQAAGARAAYTFSARSIALVSDLGPGSGKAAISIDGRRVAVINLHSSAARYREVVFAKQFSDQTRHRISVTVLGTAGHPRVDIDAFLTIRDGTIAAGHTRVARTPGRMALRPFLRRGPDLGVYGMRGDPAGTD